MNIYDLIRFDEIFCTFLDGGNIKKNSGWNNVDLPFPLYVLPATAIN